jgi:hypothetical protein
LIALNQKDKKINELVQKLTVQIDEEEKKNTKSTGKLILQLNCMVAGKYDFTISYITRMLTGRRFMTCVQKTFPPP